MSCSGFENCSFPSNDEQDETASDFKFHDSNHNHFVLEKLNTLRKNRQFCDLILQVGSGQELHELYAHRAVLAAASGYFLEALTSCDSNGVSSDTRQSSPASSVASSNGCLNASQQQQQQQQQQANNNNPTKTQSSNGVPSNGCCAPVYILLCNPNELPCMLALLEYAYTGRFVIPRDQVRTLYMVASRMRMPAVVQHCARHLLSTLTVQNCLALRSTFGLRQDPPLMCAVDAFVRKNASEVLSSSAAQRLPRIHLDLLHSGLKPAQCVNRGRLFDLTVHWMRQQLQQRRMKVDALTSRSFMLYLDQLDHRLHDCMQLSSQDCQYSEAVHEYQCLGRGQCRENGCLVGDSHLSASDSHRSSRDDVDNGKAFKSNSIDSAMNQMIEGSGRSQDLHALLDTEEEQAHLPCLTELEEQWAMEKSQQITNRASSQFKMKLQQVPSKEWFVDFLDEGSEHDSNSRASSKPCLMTRSDSSSSLSSLPDEDEDDWKLLATDCLTKNALVALAMVAGRLCMIHIRLRSTLDNPTQTKIENSKCCLPAVDKESDIKSETNEVLSPKEGANKSQYTTLAPMPRGRSALGVVELNGQLLICGGYDRSECLRSVDLYDPISNTWSAAPLMLQSRGRFAVAAIDGKVFAVCGSNGQKDLDTVEQFNNNQWSFVANCPTQRSYPGVCSWNNKLYVIGGWDGQRPLSNCDVYDPETNSWRTLPNLNEARSQVAVAVLNDRLYAVGGTNGWRCLASVEMFDEKSASWQNVAKLQCGRRGCGLAVFQEKLVAVGGHDGSNSLNTTEVYNDTLDAWSSGAQLGVGRANVGVAVVDQKLFAVGGFSGKHFLHSMEYLQQLNGQWSGFVRRNSSTEDSPSKDKV